MADEEETEETTEEEPKPQWEHKQMKDWEVHRQMRKVIKETIKASEAELVVARRKLEKLQYGS